MCATHIKYLFQTLGLRKEKKKVNVSSFSCAVTVTCHSDCVRAFVAVKYQWQCVGKCLFVSVYRF